jgi:FixJ family two-component response regulator
VTTSRADLLVYVVDDDAAALRSLCALLAAHGFDTAPFSSAEAFLAAFEPERHACLLLDLRMPGMSGLALQSTLTARGCRIPIIILTGHGDVPVAVEAMKAGAIDFIEKPSSEEQLFAALEAATLVLANRPPPTVSPSVVAERLARLTSREREVVEHLVLGKTNKQIADELGISQRTVEIHRARVREKMDVRGLSDLIRMFR